MKTVVVYYSFEGNTRYIAEILATQLQADVLAIETSKVYPKKGLGKYIWGGKSVVLGETPALVGEKLDVESYDRVIIGTPVWAGSYAPPLCTWLKQHGFRGKQVALFACHAGGGAARCFARMREALPDNDFLGEIAFVDPLRGKPEECAHTAAVWAHSLARE